RIISAWKEVSEHVIWWEFSEPAEDDLFIGLRSAILPVAGTLKRVQVDELTETGIGWLCELLPKCSNLEVLELGHSESASEDTLPLAQLLPSSVRSLCCSRGFHTSSNLGYRVPVLPDLELLEVYHALRLDWIQSFSALSYLSLDEYKCEWDNVADLLNAIGSQLRGLDLRPCLIDESNRNIPTMIDDIVASCANITALRLDGYGDFSITSILYLLETLLKLETIGIEDDSSIIPHKLEKLMVDDLVRHRSVTTTIYFRWTDRSGSEALVRKEKDVTRWRDKKLGGCNPLEDTQSPPPGNAAQEGVGSGLSSPHPISTLQPGECQKEDL
ncbi:hypothetical protein HDU93_000759, partial [Gonapodya sp. JEL0774]